jgi:hypothetical protein
MNDFNMIEPEKKIQYDVKRCYTKSVSTDMVSTTTHKVSINDRRQKYKGKETDLRNGLE